MRPALLLDIRASPFSTDASGQTAAALATPAGHAEIAALRDAGAAILLVSVELDEIMSLSDRIAVMFDGKIMGFRDPEKTDERELGLMMAGVSGKGEAA